MKESDHCPVQAPSSGDGPREGKGTAVLLEQGLGVSKDSGDSPPGSRGPGWGHAPYSRLRAALRTPDEM